MLLNLANKKTGVALLIALGLALPISYASAEPDQRRRHRGPPPEAIEVCVDQSEGDICGFSTPRGDIEGTCIVPPRGEEQLVCAPEGGPPHD